MTGAALAVDGASWGPDRQSVLLHPVSFELTPGRILGVVGANGAGKSTLLRLLYRLHKPRTGRVLVDGDDIWRLSARAAACKIAAVLQEQAADFSLSVREIAALGRIPHGRGFARGGARDSEIVEAALIRMDLWPLQARAFGTLSGGERQRVMVARALCQEPRLLILDEPTNHLDIRHQLEIMALLRGLPITIVTSLHDLNMAAGLCDDVLVLARGKALAFGAPETVLTPDRVAAAFSVSTQVQRLEPSGDRHFTFHL
ncbi:ABC transporter ATP-binding protein [Roseibium sp. RKSG952]|uniref:ABC transporter ATP-binding protein n=1 Tax=Roseibium sp. RKSG952 TaxID=2529384 RepID=UPI0012BC33D2|nr:ABC transporter ATP-binding protein [Roseibium sp. RKSG952]MTH97302.1 ABC transporter ATP-binding protein [Roseibium sp. RKSG952]